MGERSVARMPPRTYAHSLGHANMLNNDGSMSACAFLRPYIPGVLFFFELRRLYKDVSQDQYMCNYHSLDLYSAR